MKDVITLQVSNRGKTVVLHAMCYYLKIHPHFSQWGPTNIFVFFPVKITLWCLSLLCLAFVATGPARLYSLLAGHQCFTGFAFPPDSLFFWLSAFISLLVEEVSCCCGVVWCFVAVWDSGRWWGVINVPASVNQAPNKTKSRDWFYEIALRIRCCSIGRAQKGEKQFPCQGGWSQGHN